MNPIEVRIRNAIAASPARDIESRNRVYLAARSAVLKMPKDHVESSMAALFDGIRNIESEFAEPAPLPVNNPVAAPEPQLDIRQPLATAPPPESMDSLSGEATAPMASYIPVQNNVVVALLILAAIGAFLLGAFLLASNSNAERNAFIDQNGITTLFSVELPANAAMLTTDPFAIKSESSQIGVIETEELDLSGNVTLYGRKLLEVGPGQDFLMRVEFAAKSNGVGPKLKAGFINYDRFGKRIGSEADSQSFFVQSASVGDQYYNTATGSYVVSGVFSQDRDHANSQLGEKTRKIRPVVELDSTNADAEFQIRKITIERF